MTPLTGIKTAITGIPDKPAAVLDEIAGYWRKFIEAFPDGQYEPGRQYEAGDTAIDEGFFTGTNTAPLPMPWGETKPATGKKIRIRSCDTAAVKNGMIVEHHVYFDQLEFLGQLGLLPQMPS